MNWRKIIKGLLAAALSIAAVGLGTCEMTIGEAGQFVDIAFRFAEALA